MGAAVVLAHRLVAGRRARKRRGPGRRRPDGGNANHKSCAPRGESFNRLLAMSPKLAFSTARPTVRPRSVSSSSVATTPDRPASPKRGISSPLLDSNETGREEAQMKSVTWRIVSGRATSERQTACMQNATRSLLSSGFWMADRASRAQCLARAASRPTLPARADVGNARRRSRDSRRDAAATRQRTRRRRPSETWARIGTAHRTRSHHRSVPARRRPRRAA